MGALAPTLGSALSVISPVVGTANALGGIVNNRSSRSLEREQDAALRQLQERQAIQEKQLAQDNALERERIATAAAQDNQKRREALKRATARQRAQFGASGVGTAGGSSEAVLLGLFEESEDERKRREELDNLRERSLSQSEFQLRSSNILQRTQLQERQRFDRELERSSNRRGLLDSLF